jgi:hypothetical protein
LTAAPNWQTGDTLIAAGGNHPAPMARVADIHVERNIELRRAAGVCALADDVEVDSAPLNSSATGPAWLLDQLVNVDVFLNDQVALLALDDIFDVWKVMSSKDSEPARVLP